MKYTTLFVLTVLLCACLLGSAQNTKKTGKTQKVQTPKRDPKSNTFIVRALIDASKMEGRTVRRRNLDKQIKGKVREGVSAIASASQKGKKLNLKSKLAKISKNGVQVSSGKNGKVKVSVKSKIVYTKVEKKCVKRYSDLNAKLRANFGAAGAGFHVGFGTFLGGKKGLAFAEKISKLQQGQKVKITKADYFADRKAWAAKLEKLLGSKFTNQFRFAKQDAKNVLQKLKDQNRRESNSLVRIQTDLKVKSKKAPFKPETPKEEGGRFWNKDESQVHVVVPTVSEKRKVKCSCKKFKGGNKKVCCGWKEVCTGEGKDKKCKNVGENCKTTKMFMDKREYVCQWQKKSPTIHQQRCCLHVRSCCGKKCSYAEPKCFWRGKQLVTEYHRGCVWKTVGKHSRQKYCCNSKRVCQGGKCQEKKFGCAFKGSKLSNYVEEKCTWKEVKANISRRNCCRFNVTCKDDVCQRNKVGCKYTSDIVSRKQKNRCEWRRFLNGKRLRCCSWISSCAKQKFQPVKCLQHNGKCEWKGEIVTQVQEQKCKWERISENSIQKRCCVWVKDCKGKICKSGPIHCFNSGTPLSTETNGKCEWKPLAEGKGKVQVCCKTVKTCQGSNCKTTKSDCKEKRTILTTPQTKCRWVQKKDASKQRRCCSWVKRCENNKCTVQSPHCVWVGESFTFKKKSVCSWKDIKDGKQRQCCSYTLRCVGKQCYSSKYECKDVGKPHIVKKQEKCSWAKIGQGKKQRKCCEINKECFGKKCVEKTQKCKYVGDIISNKYKNGCHFVAHGKIGKRKQCCQFKKECKGKTCVTKKSNCKFVGGIISLKLVTKCKDIKLRHNATRKQCCDLSRRCVERKGCKIVKKTCKWAGEVIRTKKENKCKWIKLNADEKKKQCCDVSSLCTGKKCVVKDQKCKDVKLVKITKKNECKWTARKGGKQKRCCSYTERCVNKKCKQLHKQCSWEGHILTKKWSKGCQLRTFGKAGKRNFCCKSHKVCLGNGKQKKCKTQRKDCKFVGPVHTTSYSMKCRWAHYAKGCGSYVKRQKCCGVLRTCIGTNCKTSKGQCKLNGKEYPVKPSKKGNKPSKKGKQPSKKPKQNKFKVVTKRVKVPCKGKFRCAVRSLKNKLRVYEKLSKKGKDLPAKVVKRMRVVAVVKNNFGILINKLKKTPKSNKKGRNGIKKQIIKLNRSLNKAAPFLSKRRGFVKNLSKYKFQGKVSKLNKQKKPKVPKAIKKAEKKAKETKLNNKAIIDIVKKTFGGSKDQRKAELKKLGLNKNGKAPKGKKIVLKHGKVIPAKKPKQTKKQPKKPVNKKKEAEKFVKRHECRSNGDPHFKTFNNFRYDNYREGDFVLVQGSQFAAHARQKKWGGASVNIGLAVLTNPMGGKVEISKRGKVLVDGEEKDLKVGQTINIAKGGNIKRTSESAVKITGVDGSFIDAQINQEPKKGAWPQPVYIDIGVFVPSVQNLRGMCTSNKDDQLAAFGLFHNTIKRVELEKKVYTKEQTAKAKEQCKTAGAKRLNDCTQDVLRSGRKLQPLTFVKFEKRLAKDVKKLARTMN